MKRAFVLLFIAVACSKPAAPADTTEVAAAEPVPPPAKNRAEAIARLKANPKWLPSLDMCPAEVMPKELVLTTFREDLCDGDLLVGCAERCENRDPQACFSLALAMQEPPGARNPVSEALFLFACINGEAGGCTTRTAGRLAERGEEIDECTLISFRRACEADDAWACAFLASAVSQDADRSELVRSAEKACKLAPGVAPCQAARRVLDAVKNQDTLVAEPPAR